MKRKPDLMWVLFLVVGLGIAFSSLGGAPQGGMPPISVSSNP